MVRFKDKKQILSNEISEKDIMPITDTEANDNDKKVSIGQLNEYFGNNISTFATKDLANTDMLVDAILEAPNGVIATNDNKSAILIKQGVKVLFAKGRKSSGKLNNTEYTVSADISQATANISDGVYVLFINSNGSAVYTSISQIYVARTQPTVTTTTAYWYDIEANYWKMTSDTGATWSNVIINNLGQFKVVSGLVTEVISNTVIYIPSPEAIMVRDLSNITPSGEQDIKNLVQPQIDTKQDKLIAGTGIKIENNVISNTQTSAEWGSITGDIDDQIDLKNKFAVQSMYTTGAISTDAQGYEQLLVMKNGGETGIDTVTINDEEVEIPYTLSKTGSKIVDVAYRDKVQALYEQDGYAPYYTIDETNQNFTLPMGEIYGMIEQKSSSKGGGLELCDIGTALYVDETKGLRRVLNGSIMDITSNYQPFLARLQEITTLYPSLVCTEDEWQTTKTMSKLGQCGKFVYNYDTDGTTVTSVRLPAVVNINGLVDMSNAGLIKNESLPNITGYLGLNGQSTAAWWSDNGQGGALYGERRSVDYGQGKTELQASTTDSSSAQYNTIVFNASRSSSTYQDNAPVQQEAIQYPYFIQVATGSETENNIVNDIELNNPFFLGKSQYYKGEMDNLSWLKSQGQYNPKGTYPGMYEWILKQRQKGVKQLYGWRNSSGITTYTDTPTPSIGSLAYGYYPMVNYGTVSAYDGTNMSALHTAAYGSVTGEGYQRATDLDATWYVYNDNGVNFLTKEELDNWTHPANTSDYDFEVNTTDETFRLPLLDGSEDLPSNDYQVITNAVITESDTVSSYVLPKNGVFSVVLTLSSDNNYYVNAINTVTGERQECRGVGAPSASVYGKRGQKVQAGKDSAAVFSSITFSAFTGNGSLYYYVGETVQNANLINIARQQEQIVDLQSGKVSKSGDTMTGHLSIKRPDQINVNSSDAITVYQQPAAKFGNTTYGNLIFCDTTGQVLGVIGSQQNTDGFASLRMIPYNNGWGELYRWVTNTWSDGSSFWRFWSDGWLEQGGILTGTGDYNRTVTFLRPFNNTNYFICKNVGNASTGGVAARWMGFWDLTTTTAVTGYLNQWQRWYACGYAG